MVASTVVNVEGEISDLARCLFPDMLVGGLELDWCVVSMYFKRAIRYDERLEIE